MDEDTYAQQFGARLRQARSRRFRHVSDASQHIKTVDVEQIRRHERGEVLPRTDTLLEYVELYDCSLDWLVGRSRRGRLYILDGIHIDEVLEAQRLGRKIPRDASVPYLEIDEHARVVCGEHELDELRNLLRGTLRKGGRRRSGGE